MSRVQVPGSCHSVLKQSRSAAADLRDDISAVIHRSDHGAAIAAAGVGRGRKKRSAGEHDCREHSGSQPPEDHLIFHIFRFRSCWPNQRVKQGWAQSGDWVKFAGKSQYFS